MKKKVLQSLTLSVFVFTAVQKDYAMGNGFYMGFMLGPATNSGPQLQAQVNPALLDPPQDQAQLITVPANPRSNQFGTRIFIGNQFTSYAAIEGGLTFFSSIRYVPVENDQIHTNMVYGGTDQRVRAFDIDLKGMFPFSYLTGSCSNFNIPFTIYGKLGVAVTYLTTGGGLSPTLEPAHNPPILSGSNTYKNKFSPTYSLGASYDINQSWQTDFSYNTIQIGSNIGSVIFYALGISYHFTDKYCGQFLCDD